jgi:hypothetical protein
MTSQHEVLRDLQAALERRENAAAQYEEAMGDLAHALKALRDRGAPVTGLAEVSGLSRPTIYRLFRNGGQGYESRLLGRR